MSPDVLEGTRQGTRKETRVEKEKGVGVSELVVTWRNSWVLFGSNENDF